MNLLLVTIVTAKLEAMRRFNQEMLQIEPQSDRGTYVEFSRERVIHFDTNQLPERIPGDHRQCRPGP